MTQQDTVMPSHIRESLDFYGDKYEIIANYQQDTSGSNIKSISSNGEATCRYCGIEKKNASFKTDCHALPELIGNKYLLAEDECDNCNIKFGSGIENHFGKWSLPYRIASGVRGKKGYPSSKREHLGWRVDTAATSLSLSMFEDYKIGRVDEEKKLLEVELLRESHVPIAVFKSFVRMALAIMPRNELAVFQPVIDWIMEDDHNIALDIICSKILYSMIPQTISPDVVCAVLARRKINDLDIPYMVLFLSFSNHLFQVFIPSPKNLQNEKFKGTVFPFLFGTDYSATVTPTLIDLSSPQVVKNEKVPFWYGFEAVISQHTTRHENIATRAYFIWQSGGCKNGNDLSDWLLAEKQLFELIDSLKKN